MIRLDDPGCLLLLFAIPLWLWGRRSLWRPLTVGFSDVKLFESLAGKGSAGFGSLSVNLKVLGLILLVVALARPQWEQERIEKEREGIDIILVVDTSSSMDDRVMAKDRSNLDVALEVMKDFAASRPSDRIGLIAFARFPKLVCPLTADGEALAGFMDTLKCETQESSMDGTAIGAALAEAARRFARDDPERGGRSMDDPARVVILVTDGEENRYTVDPIIAARLCRDLGIKVYTLAAAGSKTKEMPSIEKKEGESPILEGIARITKGESAKASNPGQMRTVYDRIDGLEKRPLLERPVKDRTDLFRWLLWPAALLLLAEFIVSRILWMRMP